MWKLYGNEFQYPPRCINETAHAKLSYSKLLRLFELTVKHPSENIGYTTYACQTLFGLQLPR